MHTQSIINKLPEVIKCMIYDYVSNVLNYQTEISSDKFIGNPIDLFNSNIDSCINFYHTNKLTNIKTPLHFIGLNCKKNLPPQEILNKLQKLSIDYYNMPILPNLSCIKIVRLYYGFTEIPNIKGLLELSSINCHYLTEIPNIMGLLKLDCRNCYNLTKIPHIVGLLELNCSWCIRLKKIPHIEGLQILDCSYCSLITIPHIIGLKKLNCNECEKLTKIPHIIGLLELDCSWCENLIEIPHIVGLLKLDCFNCENLIEIPQINIS